MDPLSEYDPHRGSYRDVVTHKLMLQDVVRTAGYLEGIRQAVKPGARVIDFGAGTGVLSIFAKRCGAGSVDAIERTSIVEQAKQIAALSGCADIRFHHCDHEQFETDGPVDLIVSEWMGHFLFFESMLEPLIQIRNRWLKPDGVMVPARFTMTAALVVDEGMYEDAAFLEFKPYGIDFSPIADLPLRQSCLVDIEEHQLAEPYIDLGGIDMKTIERTPERLTGNMRVTRELTAFGLTAWFEAHLAGDIEFGTGPHQPQTHWRQIYFPLPEPFDCSPERELTVTIKPPSAVETVDPTWAWSLSDEQQTLSVDERDSFKRTAPTVLR
jgi:cyclopropane fatty-acyl-phospholipid synthase-like methyltransferase